MPRKNVIKQYLENGYYHIYNRGVNRQSIFRSNDDYKYFEYLLSRYLSPTPQKNKHNYPYPWHKQNVELLAYCLQPNHFHLIVRQKTSQGMTKLMRSLGTSYSMYFKNTYSTTGHVFESQYKANLIKDDTYLLHISRYVHLNPKSYMDWPYSSYNAYVGKAGHSWLNPKPILKLFPGTNYDKFLKEYLPKMEELKLAKTEVEPM